MKKFHIDHRNVRKITDVCGGICIVLVLITVACQSVKVPLLIVTVLLLLVIVILFELFWRCPHCDRRLPGRRRLRDEKMEYCPYCGKSLR